ncbi:MAG: hypothetical protein KDA80_00480 [Planctomycetaceae bacterium]|nr:hypothetical protein [Planctomycetaceae bacterium]
MKRLFCAFVLATIGGVGVSADDVSPSLPVTVPVKKLSVATPTTTEMPAMIAVREQVEPTLPDARLPQYQLSGSQSDWLPHLPQDGGGLRFLLALPERPLLIEAEITIDGEPFRKIRSQRVSEILKVAKEPRSNIEVSAPTESSDDAESVESPPNEVEGATETTEVAPDPEGESDADEDAEAESEEKKVAEPTEPPYSIAREGSEFVRRYLDAVGRDLSDEEVHWLVSHRLEGPELLLLNDNFQQFRAGQRPAFEVLDRNGDNRIDEEESDSAVKSLQYCDLNRDQVITFAEIGEIAKDPRPRDEKKHAAGRLVYPVAAADQVKNLYSQIAGRYSPGKPIDEARVPRFDDDQDGQFSAEELERLLTGDADVAVSLNFDRQSPEKSTVTLRQLHDSVAEDASFSPTGEGIRLSLGHADVVISGVQGPSGDQVSLGAVQDGYPILPGLDPNGDGRLTIREMRKLSESLRVFDRNADGQIETSEVPGTIRLCIGLGPVVDEELAAIRRNVAPGVTTDVIGPEWFTRMDRNEDNDLTREEFPGTDDQFAALDVDQDDLVSAQEALDFEKQQPSE